MNSRQRRGARRRGRAITVTAATAGKSRQWGIDFGPVNLGSVATHAFCKPSVLFRGERIIPAADDFEHLLWEQCHATQPAGYSCATCGGANRLPVTIGADELAQLLERAPEFSEHADRLIGGINAPVSFMSYATFDMSVFGKGTL